jgi:DNA polymerase III epsilon subunit-like protein
VVARRDPGDLQIDLDALADFARAMGPLAVVDLETTGLSSDPSAEILEIGLVLIEVEGSALTTLESLVRPGGPVPRAVQRLTGLTDADVAGAPEIGALAGPVAEALGGRTLVAHNADFERHFLSCFVSPELEGLRYLDTQDLLAIVHPDAPDLRLETFTRRMLSSEERHRALSDALDTARVLSEVAVGASRGEHRYAVAREALETFAPDSPWLALFRGGPALRASEVPAQFVGIPPGDEAPVPFEEDAIAAALSDEQRGRRYFADYRVREQQVEMARQFTRTLWRGGRLLLEGGTGVGKSLAYLAAAIPFAAERAAAGIREPVVISTRTKLLQDQLLTKDIPAAAAMLGHPELKALSIKGRANYVCNRRLSQVAPPRGGGPRRAVHARAVRLGALLSLRPSPGGTGRGPARGGEPRSAPALAPGLPAVRARDRGRGARARRCRRRGLRPRGAPGGGAGASRRAVRPTREARRRRGAAPEGSASWRGERRPRLATRCPAGPDRTGSLPRRSRQRVRRGPAAEARRKGLSRGRRSGR